MVIGLWPHGITIQTGAGMQPGGSTQAYWKNSVDEVEASWRTSLGTLAHWVSDISPRRTRADIVVSDHFIRQVVLSWSSDLTEEDEWLALARARIEVTWGKTEPWDVRIDRLRFKHSCLACAINRDLRTQLLELQRPGFKVNSIQPNFTATVNSLAATIRNTATLIVASERSSATIGAFDGGAWRHVRTLPAAGDDSAEIARLADRERLLLGLPPDVAVIHRRAVDSPAQPASAA